MLSNASCCFHCCDRPCVAIAMLQSQGFIRTKQIPWRHRDDCRGVLVNCSNVGITWYNVIGTSHFPGNGLYMFIPSIYGDDWGMGLWHCYTHMTEKLDRSSWYGDISSGERRERFAKELARGSRPFGATNRVSQASHTLISSRISMNILE